MLSFFMNNKSFSYPLLVLVLAVSFVPQSLALAPISTPEAQKGPRALSFEEAKAAFSNLSPEAKALYESALTFEYESDYVVFDFELTSLDPKTTKPTEIAALKFRGTELVDVFYTLVDPEEPLKKITRDFTHLNDGMLAGQPKIPEALGRFMAFIKGTTLVGHHTFGLDIEMLKRETKVLEKPFFKKDFVVWDTRNIASKLNPYYYLKPTNLTALAIKLGSPVMPDHSAYFDAMATAFVFRELRRIKRIGFRERVFAAGSIKTFIESLRTVSVYVRNRYQKTELFDLTRFIPKKTDVIFYLGHTKLHGVEQIAKSYFYGRVDKVVMILGYNSPDKEHILRALNAQKQPNQPDMDEEDLIVRIVSDKEAERTNEIVSFLSENRELTNVLIVGESVRERRFSLQLKKLIDSGVIPDSVQFSFMLARPDGSTRLMNEVQVNWYSDIPRELNFHTIDVMTEMFKLERDYQTQFPEYVIEAFNKLKQVMLPQFSPQLKNIEVSL